MKRLTLESIPYFLVLCLLPFFTVAQNGDIQAVNDTLCIQVDDEVDYNVTTNDFPPNGEGGPVRLLTPSECFSIEENGKLVFLGQGRPECCREHTLEYRYVNCEGDLCVGIVSITVKCPKPECFLVNLEDYQAGEGDPTGGGNDRTECAYACENSEAVYYVSYDPLSSYTWNVIGGSFVAGANPAEIIVTWGPMGTGSVSVAVTDADGAVSMLEVCVDILEGPDAGFVPTATTVCLNAPVSFDNTTTGASTYLWDFGDGNTSTAFEPTHQYDTPGTYSVTLYATRNNYDEKGNPLCCCTDSTSVDIVVDPLEGPPIYCISTLCANDSTKYWTDAANCGTYNWSVLDADGNALAFDGQGNDTICVQWGEGPFGVVTLEVADCDDAYCDAPTTAIVPIIPSVVVVSGPEEVCANSTASYSVPKWMSALYEWEIMGGTILEGGDGNTVVVQWNGPGTGKIKVSYASDFLSGLPNQEPSDCEGMGMLEVDIKPAFNVSGPVPGVVCANTTSSFFATGAPSSAYDWFVDPSVSFTGQGTNILNVTWDGGPGTYTVTTVPTDPTVYCNDTIRTTVRVEALPPADGIDGPVLICPGESALYTAQTSEAGVGFIWNVSGGTPAFFIGSSVNITWDASGSYGISLQQYQLSAPFCVSDPISLTVAPKTIAIPPTISGPPACTNDVSMYSAGPPQDPDAVFNWAISPATAGSVIAGQGTPNIQVQWNDDPGAANLNLTVELCGATSTTSLSVPLNAPVEPMIVQTGDLCPGVPATLDAGPGFSNYQWSTGETSQSITIASGGTYTVTTTDANMCETIVAYEADELPGPVADISTPDLTTLCLIPANSQTVTLYAQTNPGYTFTWYCNGVAQSLPPTQATFTHVNTGVPGTFDYWAVVTGSNGCMANSDTITVTQLLFCGGGPPCPAQNYTLDVTAANQTPFCNIVDFTASFSANVTPVAWDFGDPNNNINDGTLTNAEHTYTQAGYYLVYFDATVPRIPTGLCSVEDTVSVSIPLAADFDYEENCGSVTFTDLSTFLPGNDVTSWFWDFGDGNTSTAANPTHPYAAAGTYAVMLTVGNADGCEAKITQNITVEGDPAPTFTFNPAPACVGEPVGFDASATGVIDWSWDFDNGATNGNEDPSHTFLSPGTYNVTLTVTNEQGCTGSVVQPVVVNPAPPPGDITFSPSLEICEGENVTLTAPVGGGYTYAWSTGATTPSITVGTAGEYGVTVTDANGCELVPDPVTVIVFPSPEADVSGNLVICDEGCTTLRATLGGGYTYQWLDDAGMPIPGQTAPTLTVCDDNLLPAYSVIVTDANGCSTTAGPVTVSLENAPSFAIDVTPDSCEGSASILTVTPVEPDVVYTWSNGDTGPTTTVFQSGLYTAIGTNTLTGCASTASREIYPLPDLCLVPVGCYEVCNPDTICGPPGLDSYQWNLNGAPIAGATGQCLIVDQSGSYSLTGTTEFGCSLTSDTLDLEVVNCGCEELQVAMEPLSAAEDGACCWTVSYENPNPDLLGLMISTADAGFDFDLASLDPALSVYTIGSNWIGLVNSQPNTPLPTGALDNLLSFCLEDIQNAPQQIVFDWYNFDFDIVCSDTLEADCLVEPDCLYAASDSIFCKGQEVVYEFTVCNPADALFNVAYIQLLPGSPAGVIVTPSSIDLTANPILPGECRTYAIMLAGPDLTGEKFCYELVGHSADPNEDPSALCCTLEEICIEIPDCDPCDDIGVEAVRPAAEPEPGLCCYNILLYNDYDPAYFDGLDLCVLSANTSLSIDNPFGSGWITAGYSPTMISLDAGPATGGFVPGGVFSLPRICVETGQSPPQLLEIKWRKDGEVICRDTLELNCEPDCGYVVKEEVRCLDDGTWSYDFGIINNSGLVMDEAYLAFTEPAGMNIYNQSLNLGGLAPGSGASFSINLGAPGMAGDTVCVTVTLHEFGHDDTHTNCCQFKHYFVLPDCCFCDGSFLDAVKEGGISLRRDPSNPMAVFAPGTNLTDCDEITWDWGDNTPPEVTTGNETIEHTFAGPGPYEVCMTVVRTDANGEVCEMKVCTTVNFAGQRTVQNVLVYPNPTAAYFNVRFFEAMEGTVHFRLLDTQGRTIFNWRLEDPPREGWRFELDGTPGGLYLLEVRTDTDRWLKKIIVQPAR